MSISNTFDEIDTQIKQISRDMAIFSMLFENTSQKNQFDGELKWKTTFQ